MRISDWSSDVCSSDLAVGCRRRKCLRLLFNFEVRGDASRAGSDIISDSFVSDAIVFARTVEQLELALWQVHCRLKLEIGRRHEPCDRLIPRSEERLVGNECVRTCRSQWPADP